jgi:type VI secretion system protein ImpJ
MSTLTPNEIYCLCIQAKHFGQPNFTFSSDDKYIRYKAMDADVYDVNKGLHSEGNQLNVKIQIGQLQAYIKPLSTITNNDVYLPIFKLGEHVGTGKFQPDPVFLPPLLDINCGGWLYEMLNEINRLLYKRIENMSTPDLVIQRTGALTDIIELLIGQAIIKCRLSLTFLLSIQPLHPEKLFAELLKLLGDLNIVPGVGKFSLLNKLTYDHNDLQGTFLPLISSIRRVLSLVIESPTIALRFVNRDDNIFTCVNDPQLRLEKIVIIVSSNIPSEMIRLHFPAQTKLGPIEKIVQLIDLQLPGVRLKAVPTPPPNIPYYANSVYFEAEQADPMWEEMLSSASMALSIVGEYPGLKFEVWGIREGRVL